MRMRWLGAEEWWLVQMSMCAGNLECVVRQAIELEGKSKLQRMWKIRALLAVAGEHDLLSAPGS